MFRGFFRGAQFIDFQSPEKEIQLAHASPDTQYLHQNIPIAVLYEAVHFFSNSIYNRSLNPNIEHYIVEKCAREAREQRTQIFFYLYRFFTVFFLQNVP